jgi:hypothetical protein
MECCFETSKTCKCFYETSKQNMASRLISYYCILNIFTVGEQAKSVSNLAIVPSKRHLSIAPCQVRAKYHAIIKRINEQIQSGFDGELGGGIFPSSMARGMTSNKKSGKDCGASSCVLEELEIYYTYNLLQAKIQHLHFRNLGSGPWQLRRLQFSNQPPRRSVL